MNNRFNRVLYLRPQYALVLAGLSVVATTFPCDTSNLVTATVRQNGVAGNWIYDRTALAAIMTVILVVFRIVLFRMWRRAA